MPQSETVRPEQSEDVPVLLEPTQPTSSEVVLDGDPFQGNRLEVGVFRNQSPDVAVFVGLFTLSGNCHPDMVIFPDAVRNLVGQLDEAGGLIQRLPADINEDVEQVVGNQGLVLENHVPALVAAEVVEGLHLDGNEPPASLIGHQDVHVRCSARSHLGDPTAAQHLAENKIFAGSTYYHLECRCRQARMNRVDVLRRGPSLVDKVLKVLRNIEKGRIRVIDGSSILPNLITDSILQDLNVLLFLHDLQARNCDDGYHRGEEQEQQPS